MLCSIFKALLYYSIYHPLVYFIHILAAVRLLVLNNNLSNSSSLRSKKKVLCAAFTTEMLCRERDSKQLDHNCVKIMHVFHLHPVLVSQQHSSRCYNHDPEICLALTAPLITLKWNSRTTFFHIKNPHQRSGSLQHFSSSKSRFQFLLNSLLLIRVVLLKWTCFLLTSCGKDVRKKNQTSTLITEL